MSGLIMLVPVAAENRGQPIGRPAARLVISHKSPLISVADLAERSPLCITSGPFRGGLIVLEGPEVMRSCPLQSLKCRGLG
jgi:hypothetical protein